MLESLVHQTLLPAKVLIVNDNSTDNTGEIIDSFRSRYGFIDKHDIISSKAHLPGSKVINAFNQGLALVDDNYEFIVKLDADLILPPNYFEKIAALFSGDPEIGIAGGFVYELDGNGKWALNHPMNKNHVRGAFKAYRKKCFQQIGGLKVSIGWDTVDELLALYHGFKIHTEDSLKVKHLRPTGKSYAKKARYLQGEAMFKMRYGFLISLIASAKMAIAQKKLHVFWNTFYGFIKAYFSKKNYIVSTSEGKFIRNYRKKGIFEKLVKF